MYRLGAALFSPRAGLYAALVFNLSPLFGVVFGSFVLPDGPLDAALLAAALWLVFALESRGGKSLRWWLLAGLALGLALFSKYNAVLVLAGAFLYLVTSPLHRHWLARREPWLAVLVAFLVCLPILVWNAHHGWISFAFQGDRAFGLTWHPLAPFIVFAGEALYLLPWIWLPLIFVAWGALRRGPKAWQGWLLLCLAAPAVLIFSVIALWAHGRVLFHWAAPGYLMLFPLLGAAIEQWAANYGRRIRIWLAATGAIVVIAAVLVSLEVRLDRPVQLARSFRTGHDPALQLRDWRQVRSELGKRHLLDRPDIVIGTVRWPDAAKIGYALGPRYPIVVLGREPHEFALADPLARYRGRNLLLLAPNVGPHRIERSFGSQFTRITTLLPLILLEDGHPLLIIPLYLGYGLR